MKTFTTAGMLSIFMLLCMSISPGPAKGTKDEKPRFTKIVEINPPFAFFRAHRQGRDIMLKWGIIDLSQVSGFIVEHSYDGEFFNSIAIVNADGISAVYSYRDEAVLPGYNYYRIAAVMIGGGGVYSPVEVVRIVSH